MEFLGYSELLSKWLLKRLNPQRIRRIFAFMQGFFFIVAVASCDSTVKDTATSGKISIAADESFQPLVQTEIDAFQASYKYAKVSPIYTTEAQAVKLLLADSVRSVVMTRTLNEQERAYFENKKIKPDTLRIAREAVALIVNKKNADSLLTMNRLRAILTGDIKKWKDITGKGSDKDIVIIFDNANSSNLSYIKSKFGLGTDFDKKIFAAQSNKNVIDYVKQNPNALGLIGVSWISDSDDPKQQFAKQDISIVAIAEKDDATIADHYQPYAAYLQTKQYPLYRDLYIVSREARVGLGTGFAAYVASDKGQLIILKAGLLPATMPIRLVQVK